MSRAVTVLAPAPIRHVPAGSRRARTAYAPVHERAEIRELARAEAPPGPRLGVGNGTLATRLVDGAAWRPIGCDDAFGEIPDQAPGTPVAAGAFLAWLEGRDDARALDRDPGFARCLEGTPLLARIPGQREPHRAHVRWDVARQGAILLDGREAAPARVRDYLARDVALIDGVAFVRLIGPMAYVVGGNGCHMDGRYRVRPLEMRLVRHPGGWTSNAAAGLCDLYRFDRLDGVLAPDGLPPPRFRTSWRAGDLAGLALREDEDVELMLRESARILVRLGPAAGYPFGRERNEGLQGLAALGSVAAIEPDAVERSWRFLADLAASIAGEAGDMGFAKAEARRIRDYAARVVEPRLRARAAAPPEDAAEDAAALAGLAPR